MSARLWVWCGDLLRGRALSRAVARNRRAADALDAAVKAMLAPEGLK